MRLFLKRGQKKLFYYRAMDSQARFINGLLEASSFQDAYQALSERYHRLLNLELVHPDKAQDFKAPLEGKKADERKRQLLSRYDGSRARKFRKGRVRTDQVAHFTRQLGILLSSGIPILRSLEVLRKGENGPLGEINLNLSKSLLEGASFSSSLSNHHHLFNRVHLCLIQSGEQAGQLPDALWKTSSVLEQEHVLKKKVLSVIAYPAALTVVSLTILVLFILVVLPHGMALYGSLQFRLPLLTRLLIQTMNLVRSPLFLAAVLLILLISLSAYWMLKASPSWSKRLDKTLLSIPILGNTLMKTYIARTFFALALLVENGIPITEACEAILEASGSPTFRERFSRVSPSVRSGKTFTEALRESGLFSRMSLNLMEVGEVSGELVRVLRKITELYEEEIRYRLDGLIKLMEPLLLILISTVVALVAIAAFLPTFMLIEQIQGG